MPSILSQVGEAEARLRQKATEEVRREEVEAEEARANDRGNAPGKSPRKASCNWGQKGRREKEEIGLPARLLLRRRASILKASGSSSATRNSPSASLPRPAWSIGGAALGPDTHCDDVGIGKERCCELAMVRVVLEGSWHGIGITRLEHRNGGRRSNCLVCALCGPWFDASTRTVGGSAGEDIPFRATFPSGLRTGSDC